MFLGCRLVGLMVTFLGVSLTKKLVARSIPNINISIQDLLRSVFFYLTLLLSMISSVTLTIYLDLFYQLYFIIILLSSQRQTPSKSESSLLFCRVLSS